MVTKSLDDTIKFVSDVAAEIIKVKDDGGFSLELIPDLLSLAPEGMVVVEESGDLLPELKSLDQVTAVQELGSAYTAIRALIDAIMYQPGASAAVK